MFSLDTWKKYKILKNNIAVCCYPKDKGFLSYGNFGNMKGINLYNGFLENMDSFEDHSTQAYDIPPNFFLSGSNYFSLDELEVYQIIL